MKSFILFYVCGIIFEFVKTTKQLIELENFNGYLTREIKLSTTELFIAILIISIGWIPVELYSFCKLNGIEFNKKKERKE